MKVSKQTITYCPSCIYKFSNEEFEFGVCLSCGENLKTRPETDEEEQAREEAIAAIIDRVNKLEW